MGMRTHYDNLQVNSNASAEVIRASYRALIQKYHPDRFPDRAHGERVARIINEAFAVLGDPLARQAYDARLRAASAAPRPEAAKPPPAEQRQSSEAPSSKPSAAPATPPSNWKSAAIVRVLRRMAWVRSYLAFLLIVVCAAGSSMMHPLQKMCRNAHSPHRASHNRKSDRTRIGMREQAARPSRRH